MQLVLMSLASSLVWAASLAAMVPTAMLGSDSSSLGFFFLRVDGGIEANDKNTKGIKVDDVR